METNERSGAKEKMPGLVSILTLDRLDLTKKAVNSVLENSFRDVGIVFFR